jgi:type IV pilus assembly protein PilO
VPEFRQRVASLEVQLADLSRQLPEEEDVAELLRRVQGMATESSLTIRGFTPQAVAKKQLHMEWPIGLKLEGRYHDLGAFLERVSKFPRIINVGDIKIKAIENARGGATITAECTATTFVMNDRPAAPKPGAALTGPTSAKAEQ